MKTIKSIIVTLFVYINMLLVSCTGTGNNSSQNRVHTPDITIQTINGLRYAYYNGKAYTGDVYSYDDKHKMEIKNGIAVVAYANYGQHSGQGWENEMAIYEDIYSLQMQSGNNSGTPGAQLASQVYDAPKIEALRKLPNCSFAR